MIPKGSESTKIGTEIKLTLFMSIKIQIISLPSRIYDAHIFSVDLNSRIHADLVPKETTGY